MEDNAKFVVTLTTRQGTSRRVRLSGNLPQNAEIKYHGMWLDHQLCWKEHVIKKNT